MSDDPIFGSLAPRPLSYRDMVDYIRRDPTLSQQHTPMLNIMERGASGFGDHNQIGSDAMAALSFFGLAPTARTVDRWMGREPVPSQRVRQGWGDAQQILDWSARNNDAVKALAQSINK